MIYVDEKPEDWSKKHGIDITKKDCCECKKDIICDVPIALKGYRGFQMRKHGCKEHRLAAVFVPIGDQKDKWNKLLFGD